jgi:hypothetical protein
MNNRILHNWNFARLFRLIVGVAAGVQGLMEKEFLLFVVASFFVITAVANVGCCGAAGCATDFSKVQKKERPEEIEYEEVTTGK